MDDSTRKKWEHQSNKLNINSASTEQLSRIGGMGKMNAEHIIAYRNSHGQFRNLDEINDVNGFDRLLAEKVKPYLFLGGLESKRDERD